MLHFVNCRRFVSFQTTKLENFWVLLLWYATIFPITQPFTLHLLTFLENFWVLPLWYAIGTIFPVTQPFTLYLLAVLENFWILPLWYAIGTIFPITQPFTQHGEFLNLSLWYARILMLFNILNRLCLIVCGRKVQIPMFYDIILPKVLSLEGSKINVSCSAFLTYSFLGKIELNDTCFAVESCRWQELSTQQRQYNKVSDSFLVLPRDSLENLERHRSIDVHQNPPQFLSSEMEWYLLPLIQIYAWQICVLCYEWEMHLAQRCSKSATFISFFNGNFSLAFKLVKF